MCWYVVVACLALIGGGTGTQGALAPEIAASPSALSFAVVNTGLGVSIVPEHMQVTRHHVSFLAGEGQNGVDYNGDGDFSDFVLHLYDHRSGAVRNLALEREGNVLLDGRTLAFSVPEDSFPTPGVDLNGDGDVDDAVLHVHDVALGRTRSAAVAAEPQLFGPDGFFTYVDERDEGATDLNGDGDAQDVVLLPFGRMPRPLGSASALPARSRGALFAPSGLTAIRVEALQKTSLGPMVFLSEKSMGGFDRNGDGDGEDQVVVSLFRSGGARVNNVELVATTDPRSDGGLVLLRVIEEDQGETDLNGDGDVEDIVGHVLEADGTVHNTGLATLFGDVANGHVGLGVFEGDQGGVDLTGDGDPGDRAFFVRRPDGTLDNLSIATAAITGSGERFFLVVSEFDQAMTDLNGDGDVGDQVLFSYDTVSGALQNLSSAMGAVPKAGERLCTLVVSEIDAGADFNFDGDLDDLVLGFYDAEQDAFWNTQIAVEDDRSPQNFFWFKNDVLLLSGRFAVFQAWEWKHGPGGTDFNGDGDANDEVVFVFDAETGLVENTGLAGNPGLGDGLLGIAVSEGKQGAMDLNGDGDTNDWVLHVVRLD